MGLRSIRVSVAIGGGGMLTASLGRESKMENLFSKAIADLYYQTILVSGTSIKTINGTSLLGSGDIVVSWGGITGTLSNQTDLQAALDAKQPLDSDLTAIAALTTTPNGRALLTESAAPSGTGALARVTSPVFGQITTAAIAATGNSTINGQLGFGPGGNCFYANSNYHLQAWNGAVIGWSAASGVGNGSVFSTTLSQSSAGVVQVGSGTTANALGSLACANVIASGQIHFGGITKTSLLALTPNTSTQGVWRITDAPQPQSLAYPDGTSWRYVHDNSIVT